MPLIGSLKLRALSKESFVQLYTFMRGQGKSAKTIKRVHIVLRMALNDAVEDEKIRRNPTDYIRLTTKRRRTRSSKDPAAPATSRRIRAMDVEQANRFLAAAKEDRLSALWHLLLTGGLRPGEALGLSWRDVDFDAGTVCITHSLTRVPGVKGWSLEEPKTELSNRTVPLPAVAMDELRVWKTKQKREKLEAGKEWQGHGFVFTSHFGAPLDGANLYVRSFKPVMAKAGLVEWGPEPAKRKGQPGPLKRRSSKPLFRIYDLRHSCATLLLASGENLKVVSERLGHSTIVLTANTYSHVLPTMQAGAAARMQVMFGS